MPVTVRPIIFSGPMVRALLDGRKTMTRRLLRPRKGVTLKDLDWSDRPDGMREGKVPRDLLAVPWQPGDLLWAREAWSHTGSGVWSISDASLAHGGKLIYRATDPEPCAGCWWPSIHMPRWASRLTLEVTAVKVERLQDISATDAVKEGIAPVTRDSIRNGGGVRGWGLPEHGGLGRPSAREAFADLWNSLHGAGAWDENPWVAAISFRVHRCNVDQMQA